MILHTLQVLGVGVVSLLATGGTVLGEPDEGARTSDQTFSPAPMLNAVPGAVARRVQAAAMERRAFADMQMAFNAAEQDFARTPEYRQAFADAKRAYDDYLQVRASVLAPLLADPVYRGRVTMRDTFAESLTDLREREADPTTISAAADLVMQHAAAVSDMESEVIFDSAELDEARRGMVAAADRLREVEGEFRYELPRRPEVVRVRESLRDARIVALTAHAEAYAQVEVARTALDLTRFLSRDAVYRNPTLFGSGYVASGWGNVWGGGRVIRVTGGGAVPYHGFTRLPAGR